jgi:predicted ATP-grasp superfamily ATP-dependent carboligase
MRSLKADSIIILGASTRAAAQSALRAGLSPWCIDLYADRDLRAIASVKNCPADGYPYAMLNMLADAPTSDGPVLFTGKMEDYTDFIDAVADQRALVGSSPDAMRLARDPKVIASIKALPECDVTLIKPKRGFGIRPYQPGELVDDDHYLQPLIVGRSISAVFDDGILLGATEQMVDSYRYDGSIGPITVDADQLQQLGTSVVDRCGLAGMYGMDLILCDDGQMYPIEINPRYTASVEVLERAQPGRVCGKRIVYAHTDLVAQDLYELLEEHEVADVPAIGEQISAGHPVCTVFAHAEDSDSCDAKLRELADRLYTAVTI